MFNLAKIAVRNLRRYRRRSLLTISLIAFGVVFVLVFVAVSSSFKDLMIRQITDSYLGDLQIHRRGYVASIETLPLNLNLNLKQAPTVEKVLNEHRGGNASYLGANQVRRDVQQFCRDDEHSH